MSGGQAVEGVADHHDAAIAFGVDDAGLVAVSLAPQVARGGMELLVRDAARNPRAAVFADQASEAQCVLLSESGHFYLLVCRDTRLMRRVSTSSGRIMAK